MIYVYGVIGFILGFFGGLAVVNIFLRRYSAKDLVKDKSLHRTYGLAVWIFAGLGAWGGVLLYSRTHF